MIFKSSYENTSSTVEFTEPGDSIFLLISSWKSATLYITEGFIEEFWCWNDGVAFKLGINILHLTESFHTTVKLSYIDILSLKYL